MKKILDPIENYKKTKEIVGYTERHETPESKYKKMGFKCGLEVHQQLKTEKKLFCRCPTGIYQKDDDFDSEVLRHMRPTLSELGEYDGTALMEQKTRKNIKYRIKNESSCTYEIDDTPPFQINQDALNKAIEIAILLGSSIVGELHITRKQYLDGSIPGGFQRTAIVGIEGSIPLRKKKVKIIQLSIEEDSCREISDIGHDRIFKTDRLGMPLIETVTYPEMTTPVEAAEACNYIRFLNRSTGKVNTGIGATREDVNVSITGGTRIEIKGVAHIKWIPILTHIEAFRQKALLEIKKKTNKLIKNKDEWEISKLKLSNDIISKYNFLSQLKNNNTNKIYAVNLPNFKGILSHYTQPGHTFENEITDRLKVIACLEKPNMTSSESLETKLDIGFFEEIRKILGSKDNDAQIVFWGPKEDIKTAMETIEERCKMAFDGVPEETRKSFKNGTTIFERVLPGPDRMYPDTDSPPLSIEEGVIETIKEDLPSAIIDMTDKMKEWKIPGDTFPFILSKNLYPLLERIIIDFEENPVFAGTIIGHNLKFINGQLQSNPLFNYNKLYDIFKFVKDNKLEKNIIKKIIPVVFEHPNMDFESILTTIGYKKVSKKNIISNIKDLKDKFNDIKISDEKDAEVLWIMGQLAPLAIGNINLSELEKIVRG